MNMRNNKLSAFTVMELLVVLILSGLLMSVVAGVFYNLQTYRTELNGKADPINNRKKVNYLLVSDIEKSAVLKMDGKDLACVSRTDTVFYSFNEEFISRKQQIELDTFQIVNEITKIKNIEGLLTSFELTLVTEGGIESTYFYQKEYGVAQFFNTDQ